MKVYAHYVQHRGMALRWRTLIQVGCSWQIVGSVVMKNPGSALPLDASQPVTDMFVSPELQAIDDSAPWFEFKPDITMNCIVRLFAQAGCKEGVIQIFNLFNIREADLGRALQLYNGLLEAGSGSGVASNSADALISTTMQDISQLSGLVYLGWGPLGNDERFRQKAQQIFDAVKDRMNYLNPDFDSNPFFHPLYLMQYGAKKPEVIEMRRLFEATMLSIT